MPRYRLILEYDGSFFSGWQWQEKQKTVQGVVQDALFRLTGEPLTVWGAGRTDKGVHALGQVAHVESTGPLSTRALRQGTNFYLKNEGICVVDAAEVPDRFHARFSAIGRHYEYKMFLRPSPSPLWKNRAWWLPYTLDPEAMAEAALVLQGTHDFSSFRCADCQASSPVRTLDVLRVEAHAPGITIYAQSRSFLHHQVRMMVGALVQVGRGRWTAEDLRRVLQERKRGHGAVTAPAHGLYLTHVVYPPFEG